MISAQIIVPVLFVIGVALLMLDGAYSQHLARIESIRFIAWMFILFGFVGLAIVYINRTMATG